MGVECIVQQPSNDKTFDGGVALAITGGTPPYTIFWEVGSYAPALANLSVGEYSATVVDYYGDFTANTTCVLTAETLTISGMCFVVEGIVEGGVVYISSESLGLKNGKPYYFLQYGTLQLGYVFWDTGTNQWVFCITIDCQTQSYNTLDNGSSFYPTGETGNWVIGSDSPYLIDQSYVGTCQIPVIPKEETSLCVLLVIRSDKEGILTETLQIQLDPSSNINGQPSWTSDTSQYLMYWNTGSTPSQWTMTGYPNPSVLLISNDPSYPPLSNWQSLGNPQVSNMSVASGECSTDYIINVSAVVNDGACGVGGSIIVQGLGGFSPYTYSIDGGNSYQPSPIFNNVAPAYYNIYVKDINNTIGTLSNVQVQNTPATNYNLTLNVNYTLNTFIVTAPVLPAGVSLSFDLVMNSWFTYYPIGLTPPPLYNNIMTINGTYTMSLTNTTLNLVPLTGPCTVGGPINATQIHNTYTNTITLTSNQTVTGSTTNSIINAPSGSCQGAVGYYQLSMVNPAVINCNCCTLSLTNPKQPVPPPIQ
jgi:hypothetical protein